MTTGNELLTSSSHHHIVAAHTTSTIYSNNSNRNRIVGAAPQPSLHHHCTTTHPLPHLSPACGYDNQSHPYRAADSHPLLQSRALLTHQTTRPLTRHSFRHCQRKEQSQCQPRRYHEETATRSDQRAQQQSHVVFSRYHCNHCRD